MQALAIAQPDVGIGTDLSPRALLTISTDRGLRSADVVNKVSLDESFSQFVAARQHALVGFAHLMTADRATAEDLVQTALAKAYLRWRKLSADGFNAEAYVRRIIVNENASMWRRSWKRREHLTDAVPEQPSHQSLEVDETWNKVMQLPPRQRAVIALRFYSDLSVADTAATLKCSEGTVKSQTSRALANLKSYLRAEEEL